MNKELLMGLAILLLDIYLAYDIINWLGIVTLVTLVTLVLGLSLLFYFLFFKIK